MQFWLDAMVMPNQNSVLFSLLSFHPYADRWRQITLLSAPCHGESWAHRCDISTHSSHSRSSPYFPIDKRVSSYPQVGLCNAVDVKCSYLASDQSFEESQEVLDMIRACASWGTMESQLLFLTPEKISQNGALRSALQVIWWIVLALSHSQEVYAKGLLSRLVVDEAHCVSNWGTALS